MLKKRGIWILGTLVLSLLVSGVAIAGDKDGAKAFMSESWFVTYLDPGTVTNADGNTHIRNQVILVYYNASNPLVSGYIRGILNYNLDSELTGQLWGTAQSVDQYGNPLADGFAGTISGKVYDMSQPWILNSTAKAVFHGIGNNKGMRFEVTEVWDMDLTNPVKKYYAAQTGVLEGTPEE